MYNYEICCNETLMNPEWMWVQAQLAIPARQGIKDYAVDKQRQERLMHICMEHKVQLFPLPESLLWVKKQTQIDAMLKHQLPPQVLTFWSLLPEEEQPAIQVARVDYEKGKRLLKPVEEFSGAIPREDIRLDLGEGPVKYKASTYPTVPWNRMDFYHASVEASGGWSDELEKDFWTACEDYEADGIYFDELGNWWMGWVHYQLQKLPPAVMAELVTLLRPSLKIQTQTVTKKDGSSMTIHGIELQKKMLKFVFWFETRKIIANTGTETTLMESCSINGKGVKALPLFVSLLSLLGSNSFNGSIPAYLNNLPNAWQRDEGSYGCEPEWDHPTGVANSDLRLPLGARYKDWEQNDLSNPMFPFCIPLNAKFTSDQLASVIADEGAAVPDKYNMKSATGALGALALGIWMGTNASGDKVVHNFHDSGKLNKLLNRPTQARLFNFLSGEILRNGVVASGRTQSAMKNTVVYKPTSTATTPDNVLK